MKIDYNFSGQNFSDFGVYVSKSEGLLGKPKRKKPETYEYPGESGHIADLSAIVYEPRTIKLTCFISADSAESLIASYKNFSSLLYGQTTARDLILKIDSQPKLTFNVYISEISDIDKKFRNSVNAGTFTITFIEPQPQ
jgi:hypothetical protein